MNFSKSTVKNDNPDQPIVLTDYPGECETEYLLKGFRLSNMYVLKFHPEMQTDLLNPKAYALQFYRSKQNQKTSNDL